MEEAIKKCLSCGSTIRGRLDKKFCNDYCRNNFNNRQNSDQNNYVRKLNNILRKNRRILESHLPQNEETRKVLRDHLLLEGFNFNYHTHQYQTQKGAIYFFNYEYGYLALEEGWLLIVRRQEKRKDSIAKG